MLAVSQPIIYGFCGNKQRAAKRNGIKRRELQRRRVFMGVKFTKRLRNNNRSS